MTRDEMVEIATTAIAENDGVDHPDDVAMRREAAEVAIGALVDGAAVFPAERWDEECHACEQPIRDHRVDGRCP